MRHTTTTLAVISGKGGVGKSVIAVNLAEALAREERVTALIDADFGQAAAPVLMNEQPEHTVFDHTRRAATLDQVLHRAASNLTLSVGAVDRPRSEKQRGDLYQGLDQLIQRLRRTHEFIIIDAPAGMGPTVRWALDRSNTGLLVVVGEPTAVADAYRLTRMTWEQEPDYPLQTVVNLTDTKAEARSIANRFSLITDRFTDNEPEYLGWIPYAREIQRSVMEQHPVGRQSGPIRDRFDELAHTLVRGRKSRQRTQQVSS